MTSQTQTALFLRIHGFLYKTGQWFGPIQSGFLGSSLIINLDCCGIWTQSADRSLIDKWMGKF